MTLLEGMSHSLTWKLGTSRASSLLSTQQMALCFPQNQKDPGSVFSSVQFSSVSQSCPTLCDPMDCSMAGFPILHYLPEFAQIHVHWVDEAINHLILCCPLLLPFSSHLQSSPASGSFPMNQFFASGDQSTGVSFSISPSNEYSGLISFRIDWFDLLGIQGTLKSLLQHHNLKVSVLWHSAFFMVQLSHD